MSGKWCTLGLFNVKVIFKKGRDVIIFVSDIIDQSLVTLAFLWDKLSQLRFQKDLTRKKIFFVGWFWLQLCNLGMALVMAMECCSIEEEELKLKVRNFCRLFLCSEKLQGKNWLGGYFSSAILNRAKVICVRN